MSDRCCEGVRPLKFSRRYFLKQGGVAMVGLSAMPAFLQRAVAATPMPNKKQLVVLFQRGAADGLNIVVPFGEPNYYRMRPTIAIPQPPRRRRERGYRSRRILRLASESRAARAAVSQESTRHRARRGLARSDALAFRRAGLHGIRHARRESHRRWLAESRPRNSPGRRRFSVSRRGHGAESTAHAARKRAGDCSAGLEAVQSDAASARDGRGCRRRLRGHVRADRRPRAARHRHGNV